MKFNAHVSVPPPSPCLRSSKATLPDSSSTSSCNSSAAASPALPPPSTPASHVYSHQQFHFPDVISELAPSVTHSQVREIKQG